MRKANNVVRIPVSTYDRFFRYWMEFLRPFHNLTNREIDVIACLLKHRYELSKVISDTALLDKVVMNEDTRKKVRDECSITVPYFQVIMNKLKKSRIIVDGKINPRFIPNIKEDDEGSFQLLIYFEFK